MKPIYLKEKNIFIKRSNFSNPNTYNALDSALAFLAFGVAFFIINLLFTLILKNVDTSNIILLLAGLSIFVSQGTIFLIALIFSKVKKVSLYSGGGYICKFDFVNILMGLVACLAGYALLSPTHMAFSQDITQIIIAIKEQYFPDGSDIVTQPGLIGVIDSLSAFALVAPLVTITIGVLPAICEEALFRGVIMRGLRQFGDVFAIICSAGIFAIMHGNYEQLILQFTIGLIIATAVMLTDNIFVGMAIHCCYNVFVLLFALYGELLGLLIPSFTAFYEVITIIMGFVLAIVAIIYFVKMLLASYKNQILKNPKQPKATKYFLTKDDKFTNDIVVKNYVEVEENFYKKGTTYQFYDGKKFVDFNKRSNKVASIIVLVVACIISLVNIFVY